MRKLTDDIVEPPPIIPYFASALLFVSVTTLVLFFASGMYSEKIAYANQSVPIIIFCPPCLDSFCNLINHRYVPHANRALRSFNMYLNVRKPPLSSRFPFNPLSFFFPRPRDPVPPSRSSSPTRSSKSPSTSIPMTPIPPASNPRGELIFSSRVHSSFREAYERYRSTFERKREEREREELAKTWYGWIWLKFVRRHPTFTPPVLGGAIPATAKNSRAGSSTPTLTPNPSRRSSPVPPRRGGVSRSGTPKSGENNGSLVV
jgi:hypothetical protein